MKFANFKELCFQSYAKGICEVIKMNNAKL